MISSHPQLVPKAWTGKDREAQALLVMIRGALNVVRRGL